MAGKAVGRGERLILMCLGESGILRIMAVDAQRRSIFGQMEIKFALASLARFVGDVASVAAHIERRVPAAAFRAHSSQCGGSPGKDSCPGCRR